MRIYILPITLVIKTRSNKDAVLKMCTLFIENKHMLNLQDREPQERYHGRDDPPDNPGFATDPPRKAFISSTQSLISRRQFLTHLWSSFLYWAKFLHEPLKFLHPTRTSHSPRALFVCLLLFCPRTNRWGKKWYLMPELQRIKKIKNRRWTRLWRIDRYFNPVVHFMLFL